LSLAKLLSLLQTESLHFARADKLDDPYEGTRPLGNLTALRAASDEMARQGEEPLDEQTYEQMDLLHRVTLADQVYVGCWHGGEGESVAMWRQYGSHEGAVAVQSTYSRLVKALPRRTDEVAGIYVGTVAYADYHDATVGIPEFQFALLRPLIWKRLEYEYEQEARAFAAIPTQPPTEAAPNGVDVTVSVVDLIESIVVAPTTPDWTKTAIEKLVRDSGLDVSVTTSTIAMRPPVEPLSISDIVTMQRLFQPKANLAGDHLDVNAFECSGCHITPESVRTEDGNVLRCPTCDRRKEEVAAFNEASSYRRTVPDNSNRPGSSVSRGAGEGQSVEEPAVRGEGGTPDFLLKAV